MHMAMVAAAVKVEVIGRSIAEGSAQGETTARAKAKANTGILSHSPSASSGAGSE
jgi:hypothetical protein